MTLVSGVFPWILKVKVTFFFFLHIDLVILRVALRHYKSGVLMFFIFLYFRGLLRDSCVQEKI